MKTTTTSHRDRMRPSQIIKTLPALLIAFALVLIAAGLLGMGSQAYLYTVAEDLVDKMIAWNKECGGKTDADCSGNLTAVRKTAFKAAVALHYAV